MNQRPTYWESDTLKELCLPITKIDPVDSGRESIRYIDIGSADGTSHSLIDVPEIPAAGAPSRCRQVVQSGDTVFSTVRPYLEKIAYVDDSLDGEFASTGFCVLRPGPRLNPRFLYYFSISRQMLDQVLPFQKGVSYPAVLDREVRATEVPVPPLDEQRRIVDLLEDHLSRLDAAENNLSSALGRVRSMVTSSLAFAVAAASEFAPMTTVGEVARLVQYGSGSKCHVDQMPGDVPVLRMGNVKEGEIVWHGLKYLPSGHSDFPKLLLSRGDLLFNRTNSAELVGKSAVFDSPQATSFASYLIRVRFGDAVDPRWANMAINSPQGRDYVASVVSQQVGQANVNATKLKAFPIPLPTLERQRQLVAAHEQIAEACRYLNGAASDAARRSAALRRSLLGAAFSGRLTGDASVSSEAEEMIGA